ncbi:MAG: DNA translocase FtsK, partial [Oscillospiraceae bacterium]|nr:DNA translocase FtsK [Oscillospiraceae bacterium]
MIGRSGFVVCVPVFLYLFFIHAFSGKRPVKLRTVCLLVFILLCGCISHLNDIPLTLPKGFALITGLYKDGINAMTGGVLCGLIAIGVHWLCGSIVSYILLIIAAIAMLLGGMGITVPGLVRAYRERPRAQWEEEEAEAPAEEPAAAVVNHIATKRIEYLEQKRLREAEKAAQAEAEAKRLAAEEAARAQKPKSKVEDIMSQIGADVEDPVAASGGKLESQEEVEILPIVSKPAEIAEPPIVEPVQMPPLEIERPVDIPPVPPKKESPRRTKATQQQTQESAAQVAEEIAQAEAEKKPEYCYPPIELLKLPGDGKADGSAEMRENTRRLNEALASFKIDAHIINVTRGPSVTRYEVELAKGVRLSKLTSAADDLALNLGATGVRIAPIPDRVSVVGIEVPNKTVNTVSLREVIDSREFHSAKSKSSFAVGKDIGGNCIVGNIAKLPHMLIAGTTGSGKSVCMNSIIISLLYKASPDDVKLIMVDPKMVELGIYNSIPHLLIPVVTDPKKAAGSLQWAVTEMLRRYKAMSDAGVRDLESYNSIVENEEDGKKLPQVVVIIDELADLMLVAAKEVEESICRIAQMGRAAGIHLIIATQR